MGSEGGYISYGERARAGELHLMPASYGPGGGGARIAFAIATTPIGPIAVAATKSGVCWLGIHDDCAYLEAELRRDLPLAEIERDDIAMDDFARRVIAYMNGADLMLPVDVRATPFQTCVWRELCAIPFGESRSYSEIARRIGRGNASRAVGHANGSNPVAIVIPCHRVIGSNGSLTGYRWGIEYKRRLLAREMELAPRAPSGPEASAPQSPAKLA